jgi:hypothetical protein
MQWNWRRGVTAVSGTVGKRLCHGSLVAAVCRQDPARRAGAGPERAVAGVEVLRTAVPDLSCEIEQMIIAGDRVVVHLHFRGHFSGTFKALKGQGQRVDFRATDIYQIDNGRIAANWHIEDNISLMAQLQAQPPAS